MNRKEVQRFSFVRLAIDNMDEQLKDLVLTNEDKNNIGKAKQKYYQPLIRVVTGVNEKSGKPVKKFHALNAITIPVNKAMDE